jgi:glycosyltransferase involved in cell wall biosynthesis
MRNWLIDQYALASSKVHMLLNGTEITNKNNPTRMQAKEKLGLPPICFCLGYVGNIYKGYDFNSILQAMIKCQDVIPHLYLVLIGDGPISYELKKNINELGLEKMIIFTGYVHLENLGRLLPAFDVGLLLRSKEGASRYGPVSTKLATYASFHLPVITAGLSLEGYPDELAQGLFLVPPENPQALADMILRLCNHPEEGKAKARNLHNFVIKNLTWESVTKEILDIIMNDKKLNRQGASGK